MTNRAEKITKAMVLCAGLGTRMRPLTLTTPKPLIKVNGKSLLDHAVNTLEGFGIESIVINMHYLANQIETWAEAHSTGEILLSDERDQLLETGGGVIHALDKLGNKPFFVLNSDSFWIDTPGSSALEQMADVFDESDCDFLLLLTRHEDAVGFDGTGDFFCDDHGNLTRRGENDYAPYIYAGCYLVNPAIFAGHTAKPFSMNILWDKALAHNRLKGLVHRGLWLHVGTPQAIDLAETAIKVFNKGQHGSSGQNT